MAQLSFEVSNLRKWLESVERRLGYMKWNLLLLTYFAEFPYGQLERLDDVADLFNTLVGKHHFSSDEALQLLLYRLSLLKDEGRGCVESMRDFELPTVETIEELPEKLSDESRLMECIVRTLLELDAFQQKETIEILAQEYLHVHKDKAYCLEVFAQLMQQKILGVYKTRPFVDVLLDLSVRESAFIHLQRYHEKHDLGEIPCATASHETGSTVQQRSGGGGGDSQLVLSGAPTPAQSSPQGYGVHPIAATRDFSSSTQPVFVTHQGVLRADFDERSRLVNADQDDSGKNTQQSGSVTRRKLRWWYCCPFALVLVVVVVLLSIFYGIYHNYSETLLAVQNSTILLQTINSFWYSSVVVMQKGRRYHSANLSLIPSTHPETYHIPPQSYVLPGNINITHSSRTIANQIQYFYLLKEAMVKYQMCLHLVHGDASNGTSAEFFAFSNEDAYNNFVSGQDDGYSTSVAHQKLRIGTTKTFCNNITFTSPDDSYYFFTFEVVVNNTVVNYMANVTLYPIAFNLSQYSPACRVGSTNSCSLALGGSHYLPSTGHYTIIASIEPDLVTTHYKVEVSFRWSIAWFVVLPFMFLVSIVTVVIVLVYRYISISRDDSTV